MGIAFGPRNRGSGLNHQSHDMFAYINSIETSVQEEEQKKKKKSRNPPPSMKFLLSRQHGHPPRLLHHPIPLPEIALRLEAGKKMSTSVSLIRSDRASSGNQVYSPTHLQFKLPRMMSWHPLTYICIYASIASLSNGSCECETYQAR